MYRFLRTQFNSGIILFVLCVCAIACSPSNTAPQLETDQVYVPQVWAKVFAPGQLTAHYVKHRGEFGDITIAQYEDNTRALLNARPDRDVREKQRDNGDILRYRMSTGEFAVMTKDGRIRTYFKANYRYWLRQ